MQNWRSRKKPSGGRLRFNFAGNRNCSHFIKVIREAMALERTHSRVCGQKDDRGDKTRRRQVLRDFPSHQHIGTEMRNAERLDLLDEE